MSPSRCWLWASGRPTRGGSSTSTGTVTGARMCSSVQARSGIPIRISCRPWSSSRRLRRRSPRTHGCQCSRTGITAGSPRAPTRTSHGAPPAGRRSPRRRNHRLRRERTSHGARRALKASRASDPVCRVRAESIPAPGCPSVTMVRPEIIEETTTLLDEARRDPSRDLVTLLVRPIEGHSQPA